MDRPVSCGHECCITNQTAHFLQWISAHYGLRERNGEIDTNTIRRVHPPLLLHEGEASFRNVGFKNLRPWTMSKNNNNVYENKKMFLSAIKKHEGHISSFFTEAHRSTRSCFDNDRWILCAALRNPANLWFICLLTHEDGIQKKT